MLGESFRALKPCHAETHGSPSSSRFQQLKYLGAVATGRADHHIDGVGRGCRVEHIELEVLVPQGRERAASPPGFPLDPGDFVSVAESSFSAGASPSALASGGGLTELDGPGATLSGGAFC
jgi:hypothetical protein